MQAIVQNIGNDFEGMANKLILTGCFMKMISSGNKIVLEHGHQVIVTMITHCIAPKLVQKFQEDMASTKNGNVRARISQYLMLMISEYPLEVLDRFMSNVEAFLSLGMPDANADARLYARRAFLIWEFKCPQSARKLIAL
jgi:hypothetical protein